ncbi:transglycosylase domain-containing protein [Roseburia hominis]
MKHIKRILGLCILLILLTGGYFLYQGFQMYDSAMKEMPLEDKIAEIRQKPAYTTIEELPDTYIKAIVAVEDKRFYEHPGIDPISIGRAVINNVKYRRLMEGGSTITQQLAKNLYFDQDQLVTRKIAEGILALKLEQEFTKDEILELYVNCIYFGDGYYCVADASRGYFGKAPDKMSDYESTMLAGIPNAPSAYAPTVNPDLAKKRQEKVVRSMVREKCLTQEEADQILAGQ